MHKHQIQMDPVHEPRRSFWAIGIVGVVSLLFFLFWFTEYQKQTERPLAPETTQTTSLDLLQASIINSTIPDFTEEF